MVGLFCLATILIKSTKCRFPLLNSISVAKISWWSKPPIRMNTHLLELSTSSFLTKSASNASWAATTTKKPASVDAIRIALAKSQEPTGLTIPTAAAPALEESNASLASFSMRIPATANALSTKCVTQINTTTNWLASASANKRLTA